MLGRASSTVWWVLIISFPVALVVGVLGWFDDPRLGMDVAPSPDGTLAITEIRPGIPVFRRLPVEVGDILTEIDGLSVDQQLIDTRGVAGTSFVILTSDTDRAATGVIRGRQESPISGSAIAMSLLVIGTVFALTSFFVFFRSARSPEILVLSLLLIVTAIGFAFAPAAARWFHWAMFVERLTNIWTPTLFIMFFLLFPVRRDSNNLTFAAILFGFPVGALVISILWLLVFGGGTDMYEGVRQSALLYIALGLLGGIGFLTAGYVTASSPVNREQLRIMLVGIVGAALPFALLTVVPQSVGLSTYIRPEISVLGIVIVPLSFAFAIHRHQFLEIRRLVHRGAAYALISFTVLIVYGMLIGIIRMLAGTEVSESLGLQATLMVLLFAVLPFVFGTRQLAYAAVDRLLYREFVDHPDLATRLSIDAATAHSSKEISTNVLGTLATELRLSFASFGRVGNNANPLDNSIGIIPEGFRATLGAMSGQPFDGPVSCPVRPIDGNNGEAMLVKVNRRPDMTWILCLGPKVSEEPFSRDDKGLAQAVAGHLSTVSEKLELLDELRIKNAELTAFNQRLVETEEAERSRIASYLHDEPLQDISSLIWRYPESGLPEGFGAELQRIAENLRNFTARLQPAQLTDLGLVRSLEWLAAEASTAGKFRSSVGVESMGREDRFDNSIEVALYRIAQEALSNCQHHSRANNVWVRLTRSEDKIIFTVEDDGVGFVVNERLDASKQLGIIGMRERANQLGGRLDVIDRQPRGTKLVASLPCGNLGGIESFEEVGV